MGVVPAVRHIRGRSVAKVYVTVLLLLMAVPFPFIIIGAQPVDTDSPDPGSTRGSSSMSIGPEDATSGFTIVAPFNRRSVYLVDGEGDIVHTWQSDAYTTGPTELLPDGTLLRGRTEQGRPDGVQLLDWDGKVLWDYAPPDPYRLHHDFEVMPSGNILFNAAVGYTQSQLVAMGRDPTITPEVLWVEPIIEVKPNGTKGGDIVWSWDPLDHMVQEFDPSKPDYGAVADHPELIDINFPREYYNEWQHSNAVSYNPELDQIVMTSRNFDELWVIDHNTTMAEAAGHTGGAHGRGGDLLYRWGNPRAYGAGSDDDHVLWGPHDAQWVPPGYPGEGNIIVFNNGQNMYTTRPEGKYSTVEELVPPVNASGDYHLEQGTAFGPLEPVWRYVADPPEDFFAWSMGGVRRLPDGNTLVCGGSSGYVFEVDSDGQLVWEYTTQSIFEVSRCYPPGLDEVPDQEATEDELLRVDLSSYLSDLDTDLQDLVIGENSRYARVSGHELVLQYPDGVLHEVINVTVSDGIFKAGRQFHVDVRPVNDPPVIRPVPAVRPLEEAPLVMDMEPFISDPDTAMEDLTITEDSPYVTVVGSGLRFLYPEGVLTDEVTLWVADGEFEVQAEVLVFVTPENDPPEVGEVPDQHGVEDLPWTLDLGPLVQDVDSPLDAISVTSSSRHVTVTGLVLTFLYPDGVTKETVTLTVSDGEGQAVTTFNVTVEPVNDPPLIEDIPPVTIREGEPFELDIEDSVLDVDTPVENLTLSTDSPYIDVEGQHIILRYPGGVAQDDIVLEIWDGEHHATTTLHVTVEQVNDPPWWSELPPLEAVEDVAGELDLGPYMNDVDTPLAELVVEVASGHATIDGHVLRFIYPDGVLREQVTLTLSDGEFRVVVVVDVTVSPVNDPPELLDAGVDPPEGRAGDLFTFSVVLRDVDVGSATPVVEVVIDGVHYNCPVDATMPPTFDEGVTYLLEMQMPAGVHEFRFQARDGAGGEASTETMSFIAARASDDDEGSPMVIYVIVVAIGLAVLVMAMLLWSSRRTRDGR